MTLPDWTGKRRRWRRPTLVSVVVVVIAVVVVITFVLYCYSCC